MRKQDLPPKGTTVWSVCEHLYYIPGRAAPLVEYCVCESTIRNYLFGRFAEMVCVGKTPDGHNTLHYYKVSDLHKRVFFEPEKAAELAKKVTEKYEKTWSWIGDPPMRRTWEKYLPEENRVREKEEL